MATVPSPSSLILDIEETLTKSGAINSTAELVSSLPADAAAALQRSQERTSNLSARLEANTSAGAAQASAASKIILEGIGAAQTIALQADTASLIAQTNVRAVDKAAGGHDARVRRATDQLDNEVELEALLDTRADIMDDEHSGIALIDQVINDFRAIGVDQDIQVVATDQARSISADKAATESVQRAATTETLVAETITQVTIAANQKVIAAKGNAQLYEVQLAQNQANAANLKTMLSTSDAEIDSIMKGYAISNSFENRKLQRETLQLRRDENERAAALSVITLRRQLIAESLDKLQLRVAAGTADTQITAQIRALEQQDINLLQSGIQLNIDEKTEQTKIDAAGVALEASQTALEASQLKLADEKDPTRRAAIQAANEGIIARVDREKFEFDELIAGQATRVATREGTLAAQEQQATLTQLNIQAATGKLSSVLALAREQERQITAAEGTRLANAQNVQNFQAFIYGDQAAESMDVIDQQLANNNPLYVLMRQLGSVKGPKGEFVLSAPGEYAKANERLAIFESAGAVPNTITGVRILREVRGLIQTAHEKKGAIIPADDIGLAVEFNRVTGEYLETVNSEIRFEDGTNPLQPLTIPQYINLSDKNSGFVNQPLTKILNDKGQTDTNIDQIMGHGFVAMQAGTLTLDQMVTGIVSLGSTIAVTNSTDENGLAVIGAPYQTAVNMRVLRPRGLVSSIFDTILSPIVDNPIISATATGLLAAGIVLTAPITGVPAVAGIGLATGGKAAVAGTAGAFLTSSLSTSATSDFMTLDIASPVTVRQYVVSVLSSTTLGGELTEKGEGQIAEAKEALFAPL